MDVQISSDFHDYYDHMFELRGELFLRMSRTQLHRMKAFELLQSMGLTLPFHGTVKLVWDMLSDTHRQVVVYQDPFAHRSEGKERMALRNALDKYPDAYCSLFVVSNSMSWRYLRIGSTVWWLRYTSNDSWRSNQGSEVDICLVGNPGISVIDLEHEPLLAIDFIRSIGGIFYAIDYNTAPGLKGTPIEKLKSPTDIVNLIKTWIDERPRSVSCKEAETDGSIEG